MKRTEEKQGTLRWDKLDNTAHVFPVIAGNEMTNVYRISVVLKEEVQQGSVTAGIGYCIAEI